MDYRQLLTSLSDSEQEKDGVITYTTEFDFAKYYADKKPMLLELLVDNNLARKLCDQYESVSRYKDYRGKWWVRVVAAGQLEDAEISDLITHSAAYSKQYN